MRTVTALLLICLAALASALPSAGHLAEKTSGSVPDVGSLEVDLMVALLRAQNTAQSPAHMAGKGITTHSLVRDGRIAMFDAYDALMASTKCAGLRSMKRRKAVIEYATVLLNDYLFRLAKLNLHNGCLVISNSNIDFGSIVYMPRA